MYGIPSLPIICTHSSDDAFRTKIPTQRVLRSQRLLLRLKGRELLRSTLTSLCCMSTSKGALYTQGCGFMQLHSLFKSPSSKYNRAFLVGTSSLCPPKLRVSFELATPMVPITWPTVALKDT